MRENIKQSQKDRKTERQKDRKTERQKDRKTERQKDRKIERKTDEPLSTFQTRSSSKSPEAGGQRGLHRQPGLHQSQLQREQITPLVSLQFTEFFCSLF